MYLYMGEYLEISVFEIRYKMNRLRIIFELVLLRFNWPLGQANGHLSGRMIHQSWPNSIHILA